MLPENYYIPIYVLCFLFFCLLKRDGGDTPASFYCSPEFSMCILRKRVGVAKIRKSYLERNLCFEQYCLCTTTWLG